MFGWISRFFEWIRSNREYARYKAERRKQQKQAKESDKNMYPLW
jgi:hypothetical protein